MKQAITKAQRRKIAKKKRQQELRRRFYWVGGALALLLLLVFSLPLLMNGGAPRKTGADPVSRPEALYTPVPTPVPSPTPIPGPTPEPTPEPTPYAFHTSGRAIKAEKKMIALTFDDGPNGKVTQKILDILDKNKAKATFFMLGSRALDNPSMVKKVAEAGHQIGTHTHDHKSLIRLTPDEMLAEVEKSKWAINESGGGIPTLLRPPYGNTDDVVRETIHMPMINWSVDTLDWKTKNAKAVYKHLTEDVKDGDIVLMHDLYGTTADALQKALPKLRERGFQFVTIDELFQARDGALKLGTVYKSGQPSVTNKPKSSQSPEPEQTKKPKKKPKKKK